MSVRFRGSPYHKRHPTRWGAPELRSDKSLCPEDVADDEIIRVMEAALLDAIQCGHVSVLSDGGWPRYVWGRSSFATGSGGVRDVVWEARVENRGVPEYKAYPIAQNRHSDHMPPHVEEGLWPA